MTTVRSVLLCALVALALGCASVHKAPVPLAHPETHARSDQGRVMIRSGTLTLRVKVPDSIRPSIEEITSEVGGRVEAWSAQEGKWLNMTLRVPESKLEATMDRLSALGKVVGRSLESEDVTEQLIDLEARLHNLRALRDRLRTYLDQAVNLSEILDVERELARVQSEIESLEAKLKLLRDQVAMSELVVRVWKKKWFQ